MHSINFHYWKLVIVRFFIFIFNPIKTVKSFLIHHSTCKCAYFPDIICSYYLVDTNHSIIVKKNNIIIIIIIFLLFFVLLALFLIRGLFREPRKNGSGTVFITIISKTLSPLPASIPPIHLSQIRND